VQQLLDLRTAPPLPRTHRCGGTPYIAEGGVVALLIRTNDVDVGQKTDLLSYPSLARFCPSDRLLIKRPFNGRRQKTGGLTCIANGLWRWPEWS
jgi:hypothetical protein